MAQRIPLYGGGGGGDEDRDKTPTARLASPPPSAESNTAQSTISRLENKYADILNKIARRKRNDEGETDKASDLPASSVRTRRGHEEDRERTLEADNSALSKNSSAAALKDEGSFSGLSKSATVIHVPSGKAKESDNKATTKPYVVDWSKYGIDKEERAAGKKASSPLSTATTAAAAATNGKTTRNGDDRDSPTNSARYKHRNERDTSNRYKDTSDLLDSLKPTKSHYNHYGHYDNPVDSVSAYYKSKYEPATTKAAPSAAAVEEYTYPKAEKSSAASRRTKSYRTRKEASKERKHLTLKLSAVNMDIDSPPPPPTTAQASSSSSSSIVPKAGGVSGRTFRTYGAARKSIGTGLTPGGYQRSQTQKLYDFDDDIYHPPTPRDNKRKEIQNVIRKYAQYDEDDLRRTTTNPYSNPMKSATSANLAHSSGGGGGSGASHLYSDRGGGRDPIADHYGLGAGSSYYPRNHYGYDYPSYGSALTRAPAVNPYAGGATSGMHNPFNPLSKTHTTASFYNPSSYLGGSSAAAQSSSRSRKNLMSFVRIWNRVEL